jgi:hypothetical protein
VRRTAVIVATALLFAGCGSGSRNNSSPTTQQTLPSGTSTAGTAPTSSSQKATTKQDPRATVRDAVRLALAANHQLATRVLWTNRLPATAARSTRGPALAELAASAKDRHRKGLRVRMIRDNYTVISIAFGPTLARATAFANWDQRVVPSRPNGTPLGRAVSLHERARIELRRVGSSRSFVVWKVTLVK